MAPPPESPSTDPERPGGGPGAVQPRGASRRTIGTTFRVWAHSMMRAVMGRFIGPMITCRELIDFLWRYVEEDLSAEERRTFDRHVSMCRSCRAYLDSYRRTIALGRVAFSDLDAPVPDEVPAELVAGILAARRAEG